MPTAYSDPPSKRIPLRGRHVLLLALVAAGCAFLSAPELFSPWIYFTGGSFHLVPWWSGVGSFTAPDGNYQLYVYVSPADTGSHPTLRTVLGGGGHLCTPSGERLMLGLSGDMDKHLPVSTLGRWIEIDTYVHSKPGTFSAYTPPGSPQVKLTGIWGVGKIEAKGTLDHQSVAPGKAAPQKPAPIVVTLHESGKWWPPSCPAH